MFLSMAFSRCVERMANARIGGWEDRKKEGLLGTDGDHCMSILARVGQSKIAD